MRRSYWPAPMKPSTGPSARGRTGSATDDPPGSSYLRDSGVVRVPIPFRDEVAPQDRCKKGEGRKNDQPPGRLSLPLGLGQDRTPGGCGGWEPEPQEAHPGLEEDGAADAEGGGHQDRGESVRENVSRQKVRSSGTDRPCCLTVGQVPLPQDLGPEKAGDSGPSGGRDGPRQGPESRMVRYRHEHEGQDQRGKAGHQVRDVREG